MSLQMLSWDIGVASEGNVSNIMQISGLTCVSCFHFSNASSTSLVSPWRRRDTN